jgi:hypothetical protein
VLGASTWLLLRPVTALTSAAFEAALFDLAAQFLFDLTVALAARLVRMCSPVVFSEGPTPRSHAEVSSQASRQHRAAKSTPAFCRSQRRDGSLWGLFGRWVAVPEKRRIR